MGTNKTIDLEKFRPMRTHREKGLEELVQWDESRQ